MLYGLIQDFLNNWPHRLSVLGFGTEAGAPVKLENGELLKSATGAVVVPKLPQAQLAALVKRSGGVYKQATTSAGALDDLLNLPALSALDQADAGRQIQGDQWQDNAVYLIWLLLPLLLLQRKYSSLLSLGVLMLLPYQADAVEWRDLWQTKQQQAKQDYASGDFAAAQQKFNDPLWQGNAAYRSGDYMAAEQAFRQAAEQNPGADALHNLGNSLAQQQRYEEALAAYQQALQHNKDFAPAQKNADLMQQLLQQPIKQSHYAAAKSEAMALAAIRASTAGFIELQGQKSPCISGRELGAVTPVTLFPGDVPATLPDAALFQRHPFQFPALAPLTLTMQQSLPHVRMDHALEFLLGDKLR